jgi:hypothetical protein
LSRPPIARHPDGMTDMLRRLHRTVVLVGAEDRPAFKRIDASPALYDDGSWLKPRS